MIWFTRRRGSAEILFTRSREDAKEIVAQRRRGRRDVFPGRASGPSIANDEIQRAAARDSASAPSAASAASARTPSLPLRAPAPPREQALSSLRAFAASREKLLLTVPLALTACAQQVGSAVAPAAPGFLLGVWHGFIFPVAWGLSLFMPEVAVYAVPNNGGWYDFGFFIGVVFLGVGARKSRTVYVTRRAR